MALFKRTAKKTNKNAQVTQYVLPFLYDESIDDLISDIISLEFAVTISGQRKYCYATYSVDPLYMEQLSLKLKNAPDKVGMIEIITEEGKESNFEISLESIAEFFCDERFRNFELLGYGINDRSYRDMNLKYYV